MVSINLSFFNSVCLLLFTVLFAQNIQAAQDNIPQVLTPWVPWVMAGNESYTCPFINRTKFSDQQNHICAWPSVLSLDVKNTSATFSQSWQDNTCHD